MRKLRLRTKFLLSLLAISAGLTTATLYTVSFRVEKRVRENIREDLRSSVDSYANFERQREAELTDSAELIANLPNVRAMMTTQDPPTIQDASADVWALSGSDLMVFANRAGEVVALRSKVPNFEFATARQFMSHTLASQHDLDWWFGGGHLFEVRIQPIYIGEKGDETALGYLAVGHEVDARAAADFGTVAASEVVFRWGDVIVASSLSAPTQEQLSHALTPGPAESQETQLGDERFLASTVRLPPETSPPVTLTVMKSFDKATSFLRELNHILLGLGLLSVIAGSALVFVISGTFTRPLENLVAGVRALESGDYNYPLQSEGGDEVSEVTGAFSRMRANLQKNLAEQRALEERLRQAHKMEAVGRLAGGVAHDFNNLLTIIRGNGDLLADRVASDTFLTKCVGQIQKASGRAVSMTRQLLAFSRMQVLQPRVLELNAVIAEMGKMLPRLIGEHIELVFVAAPDLKRVTADPGQIEQVLMNLAVNARDAMPSGGKLTMRTSNVTMNDEEAAKHASMSPGKYVLLSVADTGHGMDADTKRHIFEPFFTTKEIGKGTGLGLATVYGIVKQSGGFIWVESAVGEGTTFEIYLPQTPERASKPETDAKPEFQRGSETVLLVEDESGVRELAAEFLKVHGYKVIEAGDGIEALEAAARYEGPIHVLLTDMIMPKMGGAELAKRVAASRPDVRIAFMTGYTEYTAPESNSSSNTARILQKPFSAASISQIVRDTLAGRVGEASGVSEVHVS